MKRVLKRRRVWKALEFIFKLCKLFRNKLKLHKSWKINRWKSNKHFYFYERLFIYLFIFETHSSRFKSNSSSIAQHETLLFFFFSCLSFSLGNLYIFFMFSRFDTKKLFANVNRNSFDIDLCQLLKIVICEFCILPSTKRRS